MYAVKKKINQELFGLYIQLVTCEMIYLLNTKILYIILEFVTVDKF